MEGIERLYLDTNILIEIFEGHSELRDPLRQLLIRGLPGRHRSMVTSELTLAELLVKPLQEEDFELADLYQDWISDGWQESGPTLEVGPIERGILLRAAVLRARHGNLRLPDAIHVATAIASGCSHFLTRDARLGKEIEGRQTFLFDMPYRLAFIPPTLAFVNELLDGNG